MPGLNFNSDNASSLSARLSVEWEKNEEGTVRGLACNSTSPTSSSSSMFFLEIKASELDHSTKKIKPDIIWAETSILVFLYSVIVTFATAGRDLTRD